MYQHMRSIAALAFLGLAIFAAHTAVDGEASEASSDEQLAADQVLASFARDLNHEPAPTRRIARKSIDHDVLYLAVNAVNWTEDEQMQNAVEYCRRAILDPLDSSFGIQSDSSADNTYACIAQQISSDRSLE